MTENNNKLIDVLGVDEGNVLDKLPPVKKDVIESVASAVLWKILYRMNNYMEGVVKQLEMKGIKVDTELRVDRTRRGAVATVRVELKDINPRLMIENRKFILNIIKDRWLKWALVKILAEIVEEEVDEAFIAGLDEEFMPGKIEEKQIVGREEIE